MERGVHGYELALSNGAQSRWFHAGWRFNQRGRYTSETGSGKHR